MKKNILKKVLMYFCLPLAIVACNQSQNIDNQEVTDNQEQENNAISSQVSKTLPDTDGNLLVISEEDFVTYITEIDNPQGFQYKGQIPCIVDFYADWCRPCTALNPLLIEFAEKYKGQIAIYKLNVDRAGDVCKRLNVESIPTLFFFKPDANPHQIIGAPGKEDLEKAIKDLLLSDKK